MEWVERCPSSLNVNFATKRKFCGFVVEYELYFAAKDIFCIFVANYKEKIK